MMTTAIQIKNLSKAFTSRTRNKEKIQALDGISLDIHSNEILGILGPNGAGKTTFLNILSTLLLPDSGEVEILGQKLIPKNFHEIRRILNMSSGYPNFPWSLTVEENLKFYGRLYGLSGQALKNKVRDTIETMGIEKYRDQRFDELSSGTKQKLSLAKALLNDPKIIFLDEPSAGLDPDAAIFIRENILKIFHATKATILLTTHNMQEAEIMCQRIAFMKEGKILKLATPQELKSSLGKKNLEEVFLQLAAQTKSSSSKEAKETSIQCPVVELSKENFFPKRQFQDEAIKWVVRCFAFTYRNYLFSIRNLFAFMELLFWPMVSLISIGLLGDFLALQDKALAFILTGAIAAGVLQVAQLDVAYSLLYEVWSKSVKHTFLTPIGASEYLFGSWIIGIVRGLAIFGILGVLAKLFFGFAVPSIGATFIFLLGIFSCAFLLGLLVSVLILLFGQKAEITAWMFVYLFMIVCGIYYPISTLPKIFYVIAEWVPITYFLEYYRQSFGFEPVLKAGLLKGFALVIVYFVIGIQMMNHAFYRARKNGVIVRLSE